MERARQRFTRVPTQQDQPILFTLTRADRQHRRRFLRAANGAWIAIGLMALAGALVYPFVRGPLLTIAGVVLVGSLTVQALGRVNNPLAARLLLVTLPNLLIMVFFFNSAFWSLLDLPVQAATRGALLAAIGLPVLFSIQFFRHWSIPTAIILIDALLLAVFARWNEWALPLALLMPCFWSLLAAAAWQYEGALRSTGDTAMAVIAPAQQAVQAYEQTIESWSRALSLRDSESDQHTHRVTLLSMRLAERLGLTEAQIAHLRRGALLHDIGKMTIPDSILQKPGRLTDEEWDIIRQHPTTGYKMLCDIEYLQPAMDVVYCHHERWDGSGYPRGLKGEDIPLAARIFALADVWDSLLSDQPYRAAWPEDAVRTYITQQSGLQFDPRIVQEFLGMVAPDVAPDG